MLESQTAHRVIQMPGVLPQDKHDILKNDEMQVGGEKKESKASEAKKYVGARIQKYKNSELLRKRQEEIIENAKSDERLLTIIFNKKWVNVLFS